MKRNDSACTDGVQRDYCPAPQAPLELEPRPGNVRQLQNIIRNAVVLNDGPALTEDMLPPFQAPMAPANDGVMPTGLTNLHLPDREADVVTLAEAERQYIERAIDLYSGNIPLAARKLGISPSTIYRKKDSWVD
jgi:two-component system repressor protein LuxO